VFLELFKSHEHNNVPATNTEEVGSESFVESHWAFLFEDPVNHGDRVGWLTLYLVHDTCLEDVDGRSDNNGVETGTERACDMEAKAVTDAPLNSNLFELIVGGKLSSVNY